MTARQPAQSDQKAAEDRPDGARGCPDSDQRREQESDGPAQQRANSVPGRDKAKALSQGGGSVQRPEAPDEGPHEEPSAAHSMADHGADDRPQAGQAAQDENQKDHSRPLEADGVQRAPCASAAAARGLDGGHTVSSQG